MTKVSEQKFVVIDTETTGPEPGVDAVVEIAVVEMTGWRPSEPVSWLVNPGRLIPPSASAVHHIVDADVVDAPPLSEVVPELLSICEGAILVAHNAPFDRSVLSPLLDETPWIDTLRLSRHLWEKGEPNSFGFPLCGHTQQELRYWLGLSVDTMGLAPHRAAADILVTGALFAKAFEFYLECGGDDSISELFALCDRPLVVSRMPLRGKHFGEPIREVPSDYLEYVLKRGIETGRMDNDLRASLVRELDIRTGQTFSRDRLRFLESSSVCV